MIPQRSIALAAGLVLLSSCGTPAPNDLVRLDTEGAARYALSTEDGIIALDGDDLSVPELPIVYWYRGSPILDDAVVLHRTEILGLLKPKTARLGFTELAALEPGAGESLYIQVIEADDPEKRPVLVSAHVYKDGVYGDLLEVDEWFVSCERLAASFAGAGVYAQRQGRYLLVGIINGTVATNPDSSRWVAMFGPGRLLPFIGLNAIAPVLPATSNFFERRVRAFRPDFEYGLERDGQEPNSAIR